MNIPIVGLDGQVKTSGTGATGTFTLDRTASRNSSTTSGGAFTGATDHGGSASGSFAVAQWSNASSTYHAAGDVRSFQEETQEQGGLTLFGFRLGQSASGSSGLALASGAFSLDAEAHDGNSSQLGGTYQWQDSGTGQDALGTFSQSSLESVSLRYHGSGVVDTALGSGSVRVGVGLSGPLGLDAGLSSGGSAGTAVSGAAVTSYSLSQQAVQQSASETEDYWQSQSTGSYPSGGTSTGSSHQTQAAWATSTYQETLAGTQTNFSVEQSQSDSLSSAHQMTSGGSDTMDDASEALHTFSRHQEATADAAGQSLALTSHVYDDQSWRFGPYASCGCSPRTYRHTRSRVRLRPLRARTDTAMETPPTSLIPLLSIAAELRAGGSSWAAVGEEVKRDPETCRHWPRRYPQTWCRLYLQAEGHVIAEAGADARMRLRILVRGNDPKLSLPAAQILLRSSDHHRAVELQADRPTAAQVSVEITEFVKYIKGLNDAQLTAHLDDFLARRAAGAGGDPAGAAPPPGEKRPE